MENNFIKTFFDLTFRLFINNLDSNIKEDLAAGGAAFNMQTITEKVEREQSEHLREYFRERLAHYRSLKNQLGKMEPEAP